MSVRIPALLAALILPATAAVAGDLHKDAAIGGAIGGALGGVVGAEVGGREGAIVGSGIGAAIGAGVNTREYDSHGGYHDRERHRHEIRSHPSRFCPPGQAKKGRC